MILSPKRRWLEKKDMARQHLALCASDAFQESVTHAMAEFLAQQPRGDTPSQSWDAHSQAVGAKKFLHILLNLSEVEEKPLKRPNDNLTTETRHD